jgi:multicomponent Na+:H+ antiporter subunit E
MRGTLLILALALGWTAMSGSLTVPNLLLGAAIGAIALLLLRDRLGGPKTLSRLLKIAALALLFVRELLLSAIRVALLVLTPNLKSRLRPAIIAFPLTATSDAEITLLANLITLTPGTLSLDVSADRKAIYVHVLSLNDREVLIRDIAKGFETKVIEVFR